MSRPLGPIPEGSWCHYCTKPAETWDHIVPRFHQGTNSSINLVPACADCNDLKGRWWPWCRCRQCISAVTYYDALHPEATSLGAALRPEAIGARISNLHELLGPSF